MNLSSTQNYLFISVVSMALLACGEAKKEDSSAQVTPPARVEVQPSVTQGAKLYAATCTQCHGAMGKGGTTPDGARVPSFLDSTLDEAAFTQVVTQGKNSMPPMGAVLSGEQISDLYAFVAFLKDPNKAAE